MPYLPFAEMLGEAGQDDGLGDAPALTHPALTRLLHQLPDDVHSEGLDRAEVFEAVYSLVEQLAADRPVVMVVEDAHWADASTRDLISFLLSRRLQGRFLLVVTFRSDEMHRRHPLRQRVAEWVRLPGVERIQLDPLPPGAVRGMVEQLISSQGEAHGARYDEDIARIVQRSQGNAFYVEELVGRSWEAAGACPKTWPTSCSSGSTVSRRARATPYAWPPPPVNGCRTTCWPRLPR